MKAVRAVAGRDLKKAKEFVEAVPAVIKDGVKKSNAEKIKSILEKAGAKAQLSKSKII